MMRRRIDRFLYLRLILLAIGVSCIVFLQSAHHQARFYLYETKLSSTTNIHQPSPTPTGSSRSKGGASSSSSSQQHQQQQQRQRQERPVKVNGVFVIKAATADDAAKTLCTLTHFFNKQHRYPVRIFVDTETVTADLQKEYGGGADVRVIPDVHQKWTKLPKILNGTQRDMVLQQCRGFNDDNPRNNATCTTLNAKLGYVYMNYWNYAIMPFEPSLQQYEYIINFDTDAFLTQPIYDDPFRILHENNLVGIFDIEAYQAGAIAKGIQETAEVLFDKHERRNRFVDSVPFFDEHGVWGGKSPYKPSIWTHFWGCRRDFFHNNPKYRELAKSMAFYTYLYRVDEQPVIGVAWALLAASDRVWYLPRHGIHLGVYHHGWVDNREMLLLPPVMPGEKKERWGSSSKNMFEVNTLQTWENFEEHYDRLIPWERYVQAIGHGSGWDACQKATTK